MSAKSTLHYLGGGLYIDIESGALYVNDDPLDMGPKLALVLRFLYEKMCEDTTKYTKTTVVRDGAWPRDTAKRSIDEGNVHTAVTALRRLFKNYNLQGIVWIENKPGWGYRLKCKHPDAILPDSISPQNVPSQKHSDRVQSDGLDRLPAALRMRIDELGVSSIIKQSVARVLTSENYPDVMTLSTEAVINPIWRLIPDVDRIRLASAFSPFGVLPPRIMHLDIFLLRSNDTLGRSCLFNYYSGKPVSGWQAFMLPFRHRRPGENEEMRQRENAIDIASFFGVGPSTIEVKSLGDQFVVSVKPDPGYSELVVYIFEFCAVYMKSAPKWMVHIDCELKLHNSVRRFRWCHPEEMEEQERSMLVDGDVIRGVHYFFGTTLPEVPVGFPVALPK